MISLIYTRYHVILLCATTYIDPNPEFSNFNFTITQLAVFSHEPVSLTQTILQIPLLCSSIVYRLVFYHDKQPACMIQLYRQEYIPQMMLI